MKKTTLPMIVRSLVANKVESFIEKHISEEEKKDTGYIYVDSDEVVLEAATNEFEHPSFSVKVDLGKFHLNHYKITGYVDEYANVVVCSVQFERTYVKKNLPEGADWTRKENQEHKTFFIYGEELKTFKFDK